MTAVGDYHRTYEYPIKVVQFGEGNFLRASWDKAIHELNRKHLFGGQIAVVQPIPEGKVETLRSQNHLYSVCLQEDGLKQTEIIESITTSVNPYKDYKGFLRIAEEPELRFIISNTTEAGILYSDSDHLGMSPPDSFPGKLLAFLYHRYEFFNGSREKSCLVFPCELIENNGRTLLEVLNKLASRLNMKDDFIDWLTNANIFFNTLVDGIVTGFPKHDPEHYFSILNYVDDLYVTGEGFQFFAIQGDSTYMEELPIHRSSIEVLWTERLDEYRDIKVRLLNGVQTVLAMAGFLAGISTEKEAIEDPRIGSALEKCLYNEIIPIVEYSEERKNTFGRQAMRRLRNPFIRHYLTDINLNCFSKYKTRILPSLLPYMERPQDAPILTRSFVVLLIFFNLYGEPDSGYIGKYRNISYPVRDKDSILEEMQRFSDNLRSGRWSTREFVDHIIGSSVLWDNPLPASRVFAEEITRIFEEVVDKGFDSLFPINGTFRK